MIKFRGVRTEIKLTVKGYYVCENNKHFILVETKCGIVWYQVHPESVAQFTGKLDKNKKEIYGSVEIDGKISRGGDRCEIEGIIVWSEDTCAFMVKYSGNYYYLGAHLKTDELKLISSQWEGK